ncbi:MAG: hypothetical protein LBG57_00230, partial [Treponema sp.]|nr:hypothetical protein [Treponema sp.]
KAGGDNPLRGDTRSSKKVKIPNREQKSRDFTEKCNRLLGIFVYSIIGLLLLYFSGTGDTLRFFCGVAFVRLSFGSIMGIFPGFTASQFGVKNNSMNYGIMFTGFALAGYFGPTIMSSVYTGSGSYQPAFLIALSLALMGIVLSLFYSRHSKNI